MYKPSLEEKLKNIKYMLNDIQEYTYAASNWAGDLEVIVDSILSEKLCDCQLLETYGANNLRCKECGRFFELED